MTHQQKINRKDHQGVWEYSLETMEDTVLKDLFSRIKCTSRRGDKIYFEFDSPLLKRFHVNKKLFSRFRELVAVLFYDIEVKIAEQTNINFSNTNN